MLEHEENEIEIIQIGPMKYSKEEEKIIAKSWAAGMIVGIPTGIVSGLFFGLFYKSAPQGILEIFLVDTIVLGYVCFWWWIATFIFTILFWKRSRKLNSKENIKRCLFTTVIVPLIWGYIDPIMTFIYTPLFRFLLQYYSPYGTFWIGAGVFLPFVLLFIYVVFPHLRPRMRCNLRRVFTRDFWREAWRKPKSRKEIKIMILLIIILVILHVWDALT
ncbi:MAG: hypothetical protein DRJ03_23825 [Chloroflexi bacterium]|nr:MAG: hypothetical protein DRJ03_23825 [Chloroflexota bacterium]